MTSVELVGALDPILAWDGAALYVEDDLRPPAPPPQRLSGAAACALQNGGQAWRLLRDPLGLNKLFWAPDANGGISVATRPHRLVAAGHPMEAIAAVPRGTVVDLCGDDPPSVAELPGASDAAQAPADLAGLGSEIRRRLDGYLAALAEAFAGARAFVCLSGGLDSSGIAVLAREHFADLVAVSFDLDGPGRRASEDRRTAERLARELGLPLLDVTVTADELLAALDTVLLEGIDWRDFNVHAGLVNAALAEGIARSAGGRGGLVITGDLANELLADYHAESYHGEVYYALPRLAPGRLRAALVRGLEASNRETGVFGAWELAVAQPYASAADLYLSIPADLLALPQAKQRVAREIFGDRLPGYVYERPKARAQLGGEGADGGVLAACVDRGIDRRSLRARFARLHGLADDRVLDGFLRTGSYRSAIPRGRG